MRLEISFDNEFAIEYGVDAAIFVHEIAKWIELARNLKSEIPFCVVEGKCFVKFNFSLLEKIFQFWSKDKIFDVASSCKNKKLVVLEWNKNNDCIWIAIGDSSEIYSSCNDDVDEAAFKNDRYGGNHEFVVRRDGGRCAICGEERDTVVHHIDGYIKSRPENNARNKLILLCRSCHGKVHHSSICIPNSVLRNIGYFDN